MTNRDEEMQKIFKGEMDRLQGKIQRSEMEQRRLQQTLEEVDRRKREEMHALVVQINRQGDAERWRHEDELERCREAIRQQHAEQRASRAEMEYLQDYYRDKMGYQRKLNEKEIRQLRKNHDKMNRQMEELVKRRNSR